MATEIVPAELQKQLKGASAPTILDVRSAAEYRAGHLPGAVHLPFWLIPFRHRKLEADRTQPVVVYCEHGPRAQIAQQMLQKRGFAVVRLLRGHMHLWRREKRPLTTGSAP